MIDLDPYNVISIYSTLDFVSHHAKRYAVTPILMFDQPLWWKATCIIKGESVDSPLRPKYWASHERVRIVRILGVDIY